MADFHFKQFVVSHDRCGMKVGTDAILLGAWASVRSPHRILDIGTGCGVIALMLAQRFPMATVHAVEIDPTNCAEAKINFRKCPWPGRLVVTNQSLHEYGVDTGFDLIVSNPPYFDGGLRSPTPQRRSARHTDSLSQEDLLKYSSRLLNPGGQLSIVVPLESADSIRSYGQKTGLFVHRCCYVRPLPDHTPKRVLLDLCRSPSENEIRHDLTLEMRRHDYSPRYCGLAGDFLLRMPKQTST